MILLSVPLNQVYQVKVYTGIKMRFDTKLAITEFEKKI